MTLLIYALTFNIMSFRSATNGAAASSHETRAISLRCFSYLRGLLAAATAICSLHPLRLRFPFPLVFPTSHPSTHLPPKLHHDYFYFPRDVVERCGLDRSKIITGQASQRAFNDDRGGSPGSSGPWLPR
jgi:hypothetical protein